VNQLLVRWADKRERAKGVFTRVTTVELLASRN
jgi:hypothetical protein